MKVAIATPYYGNPPVEHMKSLLQTTRALQSEGIDFDTYSLKGDTYVHRARNAILVSFLQSDADKLFMIDSDISWEVEGFAKVLMSPHAVTAAIYRMKNDWGLWTGAHLTNGGQVVRDSLGYIKAARLPTGFMCITREVAEKVSAAADVEFLAYDGETQVPYVFEAGPDGNLWWTEDFIFCRKWRELGGELWLAPDVTLHHWYQFPASGNYGEWLAKYDGPGAEDELSSVA